MLRTIELRRLLPITIIFLCCVVPNSVRIITNEGAVTGLTLFWLSMLILYIVMIVRIAAGFGRLRKKFSQE